MPPLSSQIGGTTASSIEPKDYPLPWRGQFRVIRRWHEDQRDPKSLTTFRAGIADLNIWSGFVPHFAQPSFVEWGVGNVPLLKLRADNANQIDSPGRSVNWKPETGPRIPIRQLLDRIHPDTRSPDRVLVLHCRMAPIYPEDLTSSLAANII